MNLPPMLRHALIWGAIIFGAFIAFNLIGANGAGSAGGAPIAYSDFLDKVEARQVKNVTISQSRDEGTIIRGNLEGGQSFTSQGVADHRAAAGQGYCPRSAGAIRSLSAKSSGLGRDMEPERR
jgi:hypothetical protein